MKVNAFHAFGRGLQLLLPLEPKRHYRILPQVFFATDGFAALFVAILSACAFQVFWLGLVSLAL